MTRSVAIIPARYGSTRLPGKPLLKASGKYLIQHVFERVSAASSVDETIVATDDERIADAVRGFGGKAVLTAKEHRCGSDRVAEAAAGIEADFILNIQGDEPEVAPGLLDELLRTLAADEGADIATPAVPIRDKAAFESPHVVKVVLGRDGQALCFSRAPVPHGAAVDSGSPPLKHIGVYAFKRDALFEFTALEPVPLEKTEKLEQLRALYHGMAIKVLVTDKDHCGIDTQQDYEEFLKRCDAGGPGH